MQVKYDYLLIDIYNIYFRASWVEEDRHVVYNKEKIETGGIYGSIKIIERLIGLYLKPEGHVYFLFDNAKSKSLRRKALCSDYKEDRQIYSPSFYKGIDYLEIILKNYRDNCTIVRIPSFEADDHVKPILEGLPEDSSKLLVSNDMDWARSINTVTHWLKKEDKQDRILTPTDFYAEYKFEPSTNNICFYKTFYGDKTDNITGLLKQLSFDRFIKIITDCRDIYDFVEKTSLRQLDYLDDGWRTRIFKDKDKIFMNWTLVSFADLSNYDIKENSVMCKFNIANLKLYYFALGLPTEVDSRLQVSEKNDLNDIFGL